MTQPSPPGDTIKDIMEERGISRTQLMKLLDIRGEQLSQLLSGVYLIDNDMSFRLAVTLGSTPRFWEERERQYRELIKKEISGDQI
jgi:HTH-type transcriptional regulator / antitoxin HigA